MTEFTAEFIAKQREVIRKGTMTVKEMKSGSNIDIHLNMLKRQAKQEHCEKYYPEALDHIEKQAKRIEDLEAVNEDQALTISQNDYAYTIDKEMMEKRIEELEIHNKNLHLACVNALDLHRESDVPKLKDIPKIIEELRTRAQELEQERRWISAYERQPKEDGFYYVLCRKEYVGHNKVITDYFSARRGWTNVSHFITHWQEKPQPLSEEE